MYKLIDYFSKIVKSNEIFFLTIVIGLQVFNTWFLNYSVYPEISKIIPLARDASSIATCLVLILISLIYFKKLVHFNVSVASFITACLISFGIGAIALGLQLNNVLLVLLACVLRGIAIAGITIQIGLCLAIIDYKKCIITLCMGFGLGYVLRLVTIYLFSFKSPWILLIISLMIILFTFLFLKDIKLSGHIHTIEELSITQPDTFVPFTHKIFVTIFIFSISFGFALAFASINGSPVQSALVYIPLLALLAIIPFLKVSKEDFLYQVSTMLVVAGYLSSIVYINFDSQYLNISNGLLVVGSEVFELLVWLMLSRISYRNTQNAVLVIAWGRLANSAGILIGANLGHLINYFAQLRIASQLIAVILFVFILLIVVIIKDLNFTAIVQGIKRTELVNPNELLMQNFDNKIALVSNQYQLTPRESEVYSLMAKGRNAGYINEELDISINTVKTHVSNIYKKLEVHSQQELIDHFEELD